MNTDVHLVCTDNLFAEHGAPSSRTYDTPSGLDLLAPPTLWSFSPRSPSSPEGLRRWFCVYFSKSTERTAPFPFLEAGSRGSDYSTSAPCSIFLSVTALLRISPAWSRGRLTAIKMRLLWQAFVIKLAVCSGSARMSNPYHFSSLWGCDGTHCLSTNLG